MTIDVNTHAIRSFRLSLAAAAVVATLGLQTTPEGSITWSTATAQEAVRGEVGRPLQTARDLIKGKRYSEALAKLREAAAQQMLEGVPPYGLVGNAQPVAAARPATSARPGPRSTSGWSAWTAPTSRACSRTAGARRRPLGVRGLTAVARAPSFISWRFLVRCVEVPFDATYLCDSREGPFLVEFYLTISCMKSSYGGR